MSTRALIFDGGRWQLGGDEADDPALEASERDLLGERERLQFQLGQLEELLAVARVETARMEAQHRAHGGARHRAAVHEELAAPVTAAKRAVEAGEAQFWPSMEEVHDGCRAPSSVGGEASSSVLPGVTRPAAGRREPRLGGAAGADAAG